MSLILMVAAADMSHCIADWMIYYVYAPHLLKSPPPLVLK